MLDHQAGDGSREFLVDAPVVTVLESDHLRMKGIVHGDAATVAMPVRDNEAVQGASHRHDHGQGYPGRPAIRRLLGFLPGFVAWIVAVIGSGRGPEQLAVLQNHLFGDVRHQCHNGLLPGFADLLPTFP